MQYIAIFTAVMFENLLMKICDLFLIYVQKKDRWFLLEQPKYLSHIMRKPTFCICENKDADQHRGNHEADQRLCFR